METVAIGNPTADARRRQGLLLAGLGAIGFSYRHGVDAITLLTYRMLFALPLFMALAFWSGLGKPKLKGRDIRVLRPMSALAVDPAVISTILMAAVFLGEPSTGWVMAGIALVLLGIWLLTRPAAGRPA